MIKFKLLHPKMTEEHLGLLPEFLSESDPSPARTQLDENYRHGGGWDPFKGFKFDLVTKSLKYPGDPPMKPLAVAKLRDEEIYFYDGAWVAVVQPNGDYEVARMD